MQILLNTDLFLERKSFAENASLSWKADEEDWLTVYVSAIMRINLFDVARKLRGRERTFQAVQGLLTTPPAAMVNQAVLASALTSGFQDFEDAVQHTSAETHRLDVIITRNTGDFDKAQLPVFSPSAFIEEHYEFFAELAVD